MGWLVPTLSVRIGNNFCREKKKRPATSPTHPLCITWLCTISIYTDNKVKLTVYPYKRMGTERFEVWYAATYFSKKIYFIGNRRYTSSAIEDILHRQLTCWKANTPTAASLKFSTDMKGLRVFTFLV